MKMLPKHPHDEETAEDEKFIMICAFNAMSIDEDRKKDHSLAGCWLFTIIIININIIRVAELFCYSYYLSYSAAECHV